VVEPHFPSRAVKLRAIAVFFVLGLALLGLKRVLTPVAPPPTLVVTVAADAKPGEVDRAIDEAILIDRALAGRNALLDPIVREQLLRGMRLLPEQDDAAEQSQIQRAVELGVHRHDPLIRQRLVFQAEQVLRASVQVPYPQAEELAAYWLAHADRYRQAERVSFVQVFLSRSRRGDALSAAAKALGARLSNAQPSAELALRESDPSILPRQLQSASTREIAARFGDAFAEALVNAPPAQWHGPIASSYGLHFVWLSSREPARLPPLTELRQRVAADWLHDRREQAVLSNLRALRSQYRIEVQRQRS
jgi:hypothetical protein